MFGAKKVTPAFNTASGASAEVKAAWRHRTHPPAREMLDAGAMRFATVKEMAEFIAGFSQQKADQKYTERDDLTLGTDGVYVATRDFTLGPLYGAASLHIIVPKGINVSYSNELGHSTVYDMNDFSLKGHAHITLYRDVSKELSRMGCTPRNFEAPPPPPPMTVGEIATAAAAHAQNGLPKDITVRRISLKTKVSP